LQLMVSMPQGAANLPAQHYRRDSSHSAQGDMGGAMNRPFVPGNNRNRNFNNSFTPNMQAANPAYRQNPGMQPRNNVPVYQQQPQMRTASNSPYPANRSPAMPAAAMHPQTHMGNGPPMPYGAYPHHLNPQQVSQPFPSNSKSASDFASASDQIRGGSGPTEQAASSMLAPHFSGSQFNVDFSSDEPGTSI
jgi:translation initiation factor 4G